MLKKIKQLQIAILPTAGDIWAALDVYGDKNYNAFYDEFYQTLVPGSLYKTIYYIKYSNELNLNKKINNFLYDLEWGAITNIAFNSQFDYSSFFKFLTYSQHLHPQDILNKINCTIRHLPRKETEYLQLKYLKYVENRSSCLTIMSYEKMYQFIAKALRQINQKTFTDKMMGLALLTGRRGVELAKAGHFYRLTDIDKAIGEASKKLPEYLINSRENIKSNLLELGLNPSNCLLFWSQAKASLENTMTVAQPYAMPVLGNLNTIINTVDYLRENHSGDLNINNNDFKKADCNFKVLRQIYAAICLVQFKPNTITDSDFLNRILGHGVCSKGTAAAYSYFKFVA